MTLSDEDKELRKFASREDRFLTRVWNSGLSGKLLVTVYVLLALSPLFLEIVAVYSLLPWILPLPSSLFERIAVLSFLAGTSFYLARWFIVVLRVAMVERLKPSK